MFSSRALQKQVPVARSLAALAGAGGSAVFFNRSGFSDTAKMAESSANAAFSPKVRPGGRIGHAHVS